MAVHDWIWKTSAAALALAGAARGDVLTVGSTGTYGSLQAAVDAAADGDVILFEDAGVGGETVIDGKGLTILGEGGGGPYVVIRRLEVRNLAAGQECVLANLTIDGSATGTTEGLLIRFNAGGVRVVDCTIDGDGAPYCSPPIDDGMPGAVVAQSANVAFSDCTIRGGRGSDSDDDPSLACLNQGIGGAGCFVRNSQVAFYDCQIVGGGGGGDWDGDATGANGGPGLDNRDGLVYASGGSITGGVGGFADGSGYECYTNGGDGGEGVVLGTAAARLTVLDVAISGGAGGSAGGWGCVSNIPGSPGPPLVVAPGALFVDLLDTARAIDVEAPAYELTPTTITARGVPGDRVFLVLSDSTDFVYPSPIPVIAGPKLYGQPVIRRFLVGTIDATGQLTTAIPPPPIPGGGQDALYFWQGYLDDGTTIWAADCEPWIVLDDALQGP